ncbi:MAG: hypothetical protein ACREBJ_00210 [Nitrosotalea sp.]
MKGTILLNYSENTRQVEDEEKARFLRGILEACFENTDVQTQIQTIWNVNGVLSAPQKVKLRGVLATYGLQVIDDLDGHMQVYLENELIAEWYKCTYKLKRDIRVTDPRKRAYLEMEVNCWSVFDDKEKQEIE